MSLSLPMFREYYLPGPVYLFDSEKIHSYEARKMCLVAVKERVIELFLLPFVIPYKAYCGDRRWGSKVEAILDIGLTFVVNPFYQIGAMIVFLVAAILYPGIALKLAATPKELEVLWKKYKKLKAASPSDAKAIKTASSALSTALSSRRCLHLPTPAHITI